jgi:hypothetical protein
LESLFGKKYCNGGKQMKMPFSTDQFFGVFQNYNSVMFPFPIFVFLLGVIALFILHSKLVLRDKFIGTILGVIWIWGGFVYHILFFTTINKAAFLFGGLFIFQGLLILINTFRNGLSFSSKFQIQDILGYSLIIFGLFLYPLIGYILHGSFIRTISLGLPCPTTIFTFGFLLLTPKTRPKYLLVIPSVWAVIGSCAAIYFGVYQDVVMLIAAIFVDIISVRLSSGVLRRA